MPRHKTPQGRTVLSPSLCVSLPSPNTAQPVWRPCQPHFFPHHIYGFCDESQHTFAFRCLNGEPWGFIWGVCSSVHGKAPPAPPPGQAAGGARGAAALGGLRARPHRAARPRGRCPLLAAPGPTRNLVELLFGASGFCLQHAPEADSGALSF